MDKQARNSAWNAGNLVRLSDGGCSAETSFQCGPALMEEKQSESDIEFHSRSHVLTNVFQGA
jgi:hypothetical protein